MKDRSVTLSSVALTALAAIGVALPAQAWGKSETVTISVDEFRALQKEVSELHQEVETLRSAQAASQQQIAQTQATASLAQTTASQAQAVASEVKASSNEPAAPPQKPSWADNTSLSGRMYFNASSVQREVNGTKTESDGGFLIKRLYLGVDHKFNDVFSANVTTDIDTVGASNGSLVGKGLYLKKAYLQARFAPQLTVRAGSADLPWIPYVEGIYGYRYVEPTVIDRTKFGTSADWGVHALGDLADGLISYQFAVVDGGGYRDPKLSNAVDFEGRISARYKGFNAAIGGYTGKLGKDVDGGPPALHAASRLDALVAYKNPRFTIGGEYFWAKNWMQITQVESDEAEGWSAFGSVTVSSKFSLFGRYDWVRPHKTLTPSLNDRYFNGGLQYEAFKAVNLALVYKHEKAENGTINTANGTIGGSTDGTYDEVGVYGSWQF